tara:strand:+ start:949 stop:1956 length:1008 start_codon:yes stop_codon:yes gene_type:complete
MNTLKILIMLTVGAYLFSCTKEIQIDVDPLAAKIVVDGKIEIGQMPQVVLRHSAYLYDTLDIESTYIHKATVSVSDGASSVELTEICYKLYSGLDSLLTNNDTLSQEELFGLLIFVETEEEMDEIYKSYYGVSATDLEESLFFCIYVVFPGAPMMIGEEGKTYTLTVQNGTESVSAVTTIPEKFEVDSLSYTPIPEAPDYSEVFIHLTFPLNNVLGHYIQYGSETTTNPTPYYGMRTGTVYSDATFAGSTNLKLPLEGRKSDGIPIIAQRQFKSEDTVTLIWKNIDKSTYDFIFSAENDGGSTPFSSPSLIQSNIEGGLGNWAGFNISYADIYIP